MHNAALVSGAHVLHPQLYSLRHGGASFDAISQRRALSEIKKRGRWRTDGSVRRYEKAALALREATKLSPATISFARTAEEGLASFMQGLCPPALPPLAAPFVLQPPRCR
eukprot:2047047-Pyramimonas_sp.AAC.1